MLLATLLFACHESHPSSLAEIDEGNASLHLVIDDQGVAQRLSLELSDGGDCKTLADLEATANGVPLTLVEPGYMERNGFLLGTCHYTRLELSDLSRLDPADGLEIVLDDGSDTWTIGGADLLADRGYQLVKPDDGDVSAGERVTLAWFPQSGMLMPYAPEVTDGGGGAIGVTDAVADGWDIAFTLPEPLDVDEIAVVPAAFWRPDVEVCDGLSYCTAGEYTPPRVTLPVE